MIKPTVTITDPGEKDAKALLKRMRGFNDAYVTIGVHSDAGNYTKGSPPPTVVEVALWQEFGTETIPERSFIRSTVDENAQLINGWIDEVTQKIVFSDWDVKKALSAIGKRIKILIQNKIKSNVPPEYGSGKGPNSPSTIEAAQNAKKARGFAPVTLIETGLLLRSIQYKVHLK